MLKELLMQAAEWQPYLINTFTGQGKSICNKLLVKYITEACNYDNLVASLSVEMPIKGRPDGGIV